MNKLTTEKRIQVVKALCEGNSIRRTSRTIGVAINTVVKLLTGLGAACAEYQNKTPRNLKTTTVQCDEIWSFCYAKHDNIPRSMRANSVMAMCGPSSLWMLIPNWF